MKLNLLNNTRFILWSLEDLKTHLVNRGTFRVHNHYITNATKVWTNFRKVCGLFMKYYDDSFYWFDIDHTIILTTKICSSLLTLTDFLPTINTRNYVHTYIHTYAGISFTFRTFVLYLHRLGLSRMDSLPPEFYRVYLSQRPLVPISRADFCYVQFMNYAVLWSHKRRIFHNRLTYLFHGAKRRANLGRTHFFLSIYTLSGAAHSTFWIFQTTSKSRGRKRTTQN